MKKFEAYLEKKFRIDANYFLRGGFWLSTLQIVAGLAGLISTALFAHYLSENDYGVYRYLIGLSVILGSFSLTGLGQSILQATAKGFYNFYNETTKINFIYNLGVFIAGLVCGLYYWSHNNEILAVGCFVISILQPIMNTFQYVPLYLQGDRQFKKSTIIQAAEIVFVTVCCVFAIFISKNIIFLFLVYITSNTFVNVFSHFLCRPRNISKSPSEIVVRYMTYAKHTSIQNFIASIASRLDTIVVFTQLGAPELAVYSIAILIPEQVKTSFKNLSAMLLPKYVSHENQNTLLRSVPRRSFQLTLILVIICVVYIFTAPLIFDIFFPKYHSAVFYSQIYALAFPAFVNLIPLSIIQSRLDEKVLHNINNLNSIVGVSFILTFTVFFGIIGVIVARIATRYLGTIFAYYSFYKIYKNAS